MCRLENLLLLVFLFSVWWITFAVHARRTRRSSRCFGTLKTRVVEGLPPGSTIFKFVRHPNIIYTFNPSSSQALAIFQISPQGVVSNRITLDREDPRGAHFTLTVLKRSSLRVNTNTGWTACSLSINITDQNDNSPTFSKDLFVGTVEENSPKGTLVKGLQGIYASDPDLGKNSVDNYKIALGNGADVFEAVTENIGGLKLLSIRTLKPLNREDVSFYVLTVQAEDGGKRVGITQIRINVVDVNDCSPSFELSEYSVSVRTSTPIGTSVLKVHARDEDLGSNGEIYYYFKTTEQDSFTIDPHTGVMRVARVLNLAKGNSFDLSVIAQDRGSPPRRQQTVVRINLVKSEQVLPISNPPPRIRFAKRSLVARIREDLPIKCHILHAEVMHSTGSIILPEFTVLSDRAIPFRVNVNSGFLYLTKPLDYETSRVYDFKIIAVMKNLNVKDEINVTVQVDDVDENFHAPIFKQANLVMDFTRSSDSQSLTPELKASDADKGVSGLVKYYIRGGNGVGKFTIDENLGIVYSKSGINWQGIDKRELLVEARDNAVMWKSSMLFVIINVQGREDCSPVFERSVYREFLVENQPPGTFVVVANAEDCVKGSKVTYSISGGNSKRRFKIEKETGIVRTTKALDREDQDEYILEITAKSLRSSKAQVFIRVKDLNDNFPMFESSNYQISITENRGRVNNLLCLLARDRDADANAKMLYEIMSGNDKNLFTVNADTGTLSSESLNFEDRKEHTLIIRATDFGVPPRSTQTTVKIHVTDVNDPPKFLDDDITVSIQEEIPPGSTVTSLPVSDEDAGENGEFHCSYENIDAEEFGKFVVKTTRKGCEVQNVQILDWFGKNDYSLRVRVTDRASPRLRKYDVIRVRVKIIDINNHPPVFSQDSYWTSITPPFRSTILQVQATDKDSGVNAEIRYSLIKANEMFTINAEDGSIKAKRKLDVGKHKLFIRARDRGSPQRQTDVTCYISVYPRNVRRPRFSRLTYFKKLSESAELKTVVVNVGKPSHGTKYHIVGGNIAGAFSISQNGVVQLARSLDYETVRDYELVIRAVRRHDRERELAIEIPLKVQVLDVNDNKPSFRIENHPLVINVNERLKSGVFITQVLAFDADSGTNGIVTYHFRRRPRSDPIYFSINPDSGEIYATKSLDSREAPYTFTVVAEDRGTPRKHAEYEVQVKVHKDSKSVRFLPHERDHSVDEGPLGVHTKVITFKVNHKGEQDLKYSIVNGNIKNSFCVDTRGTLYSVRELDRETRSNYILKLSVDDGDSSAFADLNITVNDVNDNPPQFSTEPMDVFIKENTRMQRIGTVKAKDEDSANNGNVSYAIIDTARKSSRNLFSIEPKLGTLIITHTLDYEKSPEHKLTIVAEDKGLPSYRTYGHVIITVEDDNDNSPQFLSGSFAERVPFNAPKGYPVLQTLATDKDGGLNGELRYFIQSTNMFTMDEHTGWIHANRGLSPGTFSFLIYAMDKGTPSRNDTTLVTITVEAGDGPPRFLHEFPAFNASVGENQANGSHVLTVQAASRDLVIYKIEDVRIRDFEIDLMSGRITIARPLDYERKQRYDFLVSATDRNDRMSQAHVTILIENENDNKPRIVKSANGKISCRIHRNATAGTYVTRIRAYDDDRDDHLRFSLSEKSNKKHFRIDPAGNIRTRASLFDLEPVFHVLVTVEDSGDLTDTVPVYIALLNYDLNQGSVLAEVNEGARPGTALTLSRNISPHYKHPSFSIVYPQGSPFSVEKASGSLVLEKPLDYELQREYSLTMRLEDKKNPKNYVDVDIKVIVQDENDNKPRFETTADSKPRSALIHENAQPGTLIHQFKASDKDSGPNGDVVFRMGAKYRHWFHLGEKTGELRTTGVTFEDEKYNLTVEVYDNGTPPLYTQTFIIVNVGYWEPRFTKGEYEFEMNEDAAIGHLVGVIEASSFGLPLFYTMMGKGSNFNINPKNGAIALLSPVDYEKIDERVFKLDIVAKVTLQTSRTQVTVRVKDVNDCAPKFHRATYVDRIPESAPIGTTVLTVCALDDDSGANAEVFYSLDSDDFIIDSYTGVVTTAAALDYETKPLYMITVLAVNRGTPRLNGTAQLTVDITNVNDNAPIFTSEEYACSLRENAKKGSSVTTVKATDADKNTITYDITGGNDGEPFVIDPVSGVIKLSNKRSVSIVGPSYELNVSASDGVHRGHTVVSVKIKDINDHAPVFSSCDQYAPTIPEGSPRGTPVLKVSASDEDLGRNGQIEYAIVRTDVPRMFEIDQKTGLIKTLTEFDRESQRRYSVLVKAIDGNSDMEPGERLVNSCSVEVTITDVNDNKPVFNSKFYEENVKENVGIGHFVLQVKAYDKDEGANAAVSYAIKESTSLFSIDDQTGIVTTQADLMNKKKKYKLKVLARDFGEPPLTSEVDVTVNVINSNNDPPQFSQNLYDTSVPENTSIGSSVGSPMVAKSKNPKHSIYYSIIPGNIPASNKPKKFDIDPISGVVRVRGYLDHETTPNYTLTVRAENNANPPLSSSTILRIVVTDVNDCAPEFTLSQYVGKIRENSKLGTSVLTVKAVDKDSGNYSNTLYTMSRRNEFFSIDEHTGVIRSKQTFDREAKSRYTFAVKATDANEENLSSQVIVQVAVTDENDLSPNFSRRSYRAKIHENVPIGTEVITVSASDGDHGVNSMVKFDIKKGNEKNKFQILPDGRVLVNDNIDYEEVQKYELVLRAWDGKHENTAKLTVTIENLNDNNPTFQTKNGILEAEIPENSPKGTTVTNLVATDRDFNSTGSNLTIKYYLSSQVAGIFRIDPSNGQITTRTELDREAKDKYKFQAYADDGDGRTGSVEVVVRVKDVNDNAPEFPGNNFQVAVRENMPQGTPVKMIKAKDKDDENQGGNAIVTYRIDSDPYKSFTIDALTGMLKTGVRLDREKINSYILRLNATDGGIPPLTDQIVVQVQVLDDNDHAPTFTRNKFQHTTAEITSVGSVVITLQASDEDIDANARLSFSMLNENEDIPFKVVPHTGEVVVASKLNYEYEKSYKFEVQVKDGGTPPKSDKAKVIINLRDSNDHSPYFSSSTYTTTLPEGSYENQKLLTLKADDDDCTEEYQDIRYSISDGDQEKKFIIDPETGQLSVRSDLDREANSLHVLTVRATNTAPPYLYGEANVTIKVTDVNDNAPELTSTSVNQEIFENLPEGDRVVIGTLRATDRDLDPKGKMFTFGILGGNNENLFQLDKKTGELTTSATFDRERQAVYRLEVWVRDSGNPKLNSTSTVKVHVKDRNDNQHKVGNLELTINLFAHQTISPSTPVGKVYVDDPDTDDLRYYEMLSGDFNTFTVHRASGQIYMKQRPTSREYYFRVNVSDRNSTFHHVVCSVRIRVNDIPTEAFLQNICLRFQHKTGKNVVRELDKYKKMIAKAINTRPENVDLFSIQNVGGGSKAVDVRFGAHGSPYYVPERLVAILKKNRNQLSSLGRDIVIGFDACATEPCKTGACKSEVLLTGAIEAVDDGHGKSFASVVTKTDVKCGKCEELFTRKTTCNSRPCLNDGKCTDTPKGSLCTCPKQYRGPKCELTTRSFKEGEWVWLRPLRSCRVSTLSLEFSTLREDGLLLYNGPMAELGTGDNYDFIAVQLIKGKVIVSLSLGDARSKTLSVRKSGKLNDGKWHLVEIIRNATFVRVIIDECRSSLVKTLERKEKEDRSNCETSSSIRYNKFNLLNVNEPLQIGGMPSKPPDYTDVIKTNYDGCIRNVKENGDMFDLKAVSNSKGSQEGCPATDWRCQPRSPCYGAAKCLPSRNDFSCICPPGYEGKLCNIKSVAQTFTPPSFIKYRKKKSSVKTYNSKFTKIEMMLRTRDEDGGVLMSIKSKKGFKHITLQIMVNKRRELFLACKFNLGNGDHVVKLKNALLGDGKWHHVIVTRNRNEVHLGVDLATDPREATGKSTGRFILFNIDEHSSILVGGRRPDNSSTDKFDGCIKGLRINGQSMSYNDSNNFVVATKQGVTLGCKSTVCKDTPCPEKLFCYDKWRERECIPRPCESRPCKNGADCIDHVLEGVATFKCECRYGFHGTQCGKGANVITLAKDGEKISLKLVIGLSCFVFMLALVTVLIICYHGYQHKGKAIFNTKRKPNKGDKKGKPGDRKGLMVVETVDSDGERTHSRITNCHPSMYSENESRAHTCKSDQPPAIPPRYDSLLRKQEAPDFHLVELPVRDLPPVIEVVLSPDSDSSAIYDDYIECQEEQPKDIKQQQPVTISQKYAEDGPRVGKMFEQPSCSYPVEDNNSNVPTITWNDIEEFGRKFYTMTKNFLAKDDGTRPSSGTSTTSNSSSVVTVIENPKA